MYLRISQDGGDTKAYWASSLEEMVQVLKGILRDVIEKGEQSEYPPGETQFEVYRERWGITRLPYPFLVSPDGKQCIPLFDTDFRPEAVSQDGYLVERPWSADEEQVSGEAADDVAGGTTTDEADSESDQADDLADIPDEETPAAVVAASNADEDMFEGEPE